jgi:4-amino-4-deoxy-L-arabinose transferase-like glycosyltransferase
MPKALYSLKTFFLLFITVYLGYQFFSLDIQPIPWFDETFFASIAHHLWQYNTLVPEIAATAMNQKPIFIYGPLYFKLTALSFEWFGFGIWQFRMVAMLFGLGTIAIILRIKNQVLNEKQFVKKDMLWALLLLTDPFLNLSMHEGRMDLVALFFVLLGIFFFTVAVQKQQKGYFVLVGICMALGLLTTPRVGFIVLAFAGVGCYLWLHNKIDWKAVVRMKFPAMILYGSWINSCGGFRKFIEIYFGAFDNSNTQNTITNYLFSNLYVPKHEYVLIATVLLVIGISRVKTNPFFNHFVCWIALSSVVLFYLLIKDWGPYSVFILPFYYLLLMGFQQQETTKWIHTVILTVLLTFNLGYFGLKAIQTILSAPERNPKLAYDFVRQYIPKGSKVIGDATYYYAVVQNGSSYEYIDKYATLTLREESLRTKYKYQYVMVSDIEKARYVSTFQYFSQKSPLKLIAKLDLKPSRQVPFLSAFDAKTYGCSLYKVMH